MKHFKIQTTILLGLIILNSAKSIGQCSSGVSWCTLGIPIGTTDVLGGDNSTTNPLYIQTNGTTRVTVSGNSNNVGIGTTTPNNFLQIHGGKMQVTTSTTGSASGDGFTIGYNSSNVELTQQENARMDFLTNGIQRMCVVAGSGSTGLTGYVGIGNNFTEPKSRLHLNQGSNEKCYFQMTGNNTGTNASDGFRIGVLNGTGGPYHVEFRQQENSSDYVWYTTPSGTTAVERMRMKSDGNVGIGTSIPCSLLDVKGTITATQIIIEKDNTKQDLLALIEQLQQRVAALEQQLTASIKN